MPLRIRTVKRQTGVELLDEVRQRHGSIEALKAHVEEHPRDLLAELMLRDAQYLLAHPRARGREVRTGVTYVSWRPEDLEKLTPERIRLLHALRRRPAPSIRALAQAAGRDYKNVFTDLQVLHSLGLVSLVQDARGARVPRVDFESIEILL